MKMRFILIYLITILIVPMPSLADTLARDAGAMMRCMQARNAPTCRTYLTTNSYALYDRFISYNLMPCLPDRGDYRTHKAISKQYAKTRFRIHVGAKEYMTTLYLKRSAKHWQLDLPYTLNKALGENWQKHITLMEQSYLLAKQYFGDKLTCDTVRAITNTTDINQ